MPPRKRTRAQAHAEATGESAGPAQHVVPPVPVAAPTLQPPQEPGLEQTRAAGRSRSRRGAASSRARRQAPPTVEQPVEEDSSEEWENYEEQEHAQPPQLPAVTDPAAVIKHLVPQLRRLASVTEVQAEEILTEVLAANPDAAKNHAVWLEEAQIRLACFEEIDAEAALLREAMATSLQDAEALKKKQEEEERREGAVAAVQRKYPGSEVYAQLSTVVCPSLLLMSPAQPALTKLLDLEKRSKKWYSGKGTLLYFERLAKELSSEFKSQLTTAIAAAGLDGSTAASGVVASTQGPGTPLLRCPALRIQSCPLCTKSQSTQAAGVQAQQQAQQQAQAASCTTDPFAGHPQLLSCFDSLEKVLTDKETFITLEVSKMPPEIVSSTGSNGGAIRRVSETHIPELFQVPPGEATLEVVDCVSDDE